MPKSDRPEFAVTAETQLALRHMFIEIYLEVDDFRAELIALAEGSNGPGPDGNVRWGSVEQRTPKWADAVVQFCERWGLTFADKAAEEAVHWWCTERRRDGDQCKPGYLITGFHGGSTLPLDDFAPTAANWDPTRESRADAEARLRREWEAHLKAELDWIEGAYMNLESTPLQQRPKRRPKCRPKYAEHLRWLFERQAKHLSFAKIAEGPPVTDQAAVRMACGRLAGELDLILWRRADKSL